MGHRTQQQASQTHLSALLKDAPPQVLWWCGEGSTTKRPTRGITTALAANFRIIYDNFFCCLVLFDANMLWALAAEQSFLCLSQLSDSPVVLTTKQRSVRREKNDVCSLYRPSLLHVAERKVPFLQVFIFPGMCKAKPVIIISSTLKIHIVTSVTSCSGRFSANHVLCVWEDSVSAWCL